MTSDDFFKQNTETFDLVFIDGLHEAPQVYKDIVNALEVLNEGGIIVCHDMLPATELAQRVPRESQIWNGDCFKAFVQLRGSRPDLAMCTLEADHGLGVIMKGEQDTIDIEGVELNWENFCKNQKEWMNSMSVTEFYSLL
jgi:predicted O-methyltransferase YrrM